MVRQERFLIKTYTRLRHIHSQSRQARYCSKLWLGGGERREELREKERGNVSTSEPKKHGGAAITGQEAAPNAPHAKTARGKTALAVPLS